MRARFGTLDYLRLRPEQIEQARKILPIVSVQNRYNLCGSRLGKHAGLLREKRGLGFMPWSPIGGNRGLKPGDALETVAKATSC